ncbi:MAG: basic amino acid ABC transporter substrate-binding protein [Sutterellaceae bacterium]|nr:basic amino acid ABC transporter substrate-binding protein [Sutterellaceae bacterium]
MQKRTFLTGVIASAALTTVPAWAKKQPKLVVGMDAAYPPFGSQDIETRQYVGYDVDIIRAIGKAEGFEVEVKNLAFDGLIPALKTGNIDIAINDITITPERAKSVDFSHRYYIAGLGIVVNADNTTITKAEDLEGKRLAVSIGSTGEAASRKIKGAKVRIFNQLNECYLELRNDGVDAVVNDIPTNDYYATTAGRGKVKSLPVALTREDLGIAVKKGNTKLLNQINRGLTTIKQNGEFAKIFEKWFGRKPEPELLKD